MATCSCGETDPSKFYVCKGGSLLNMCKPCRAKYNLARKGKYKEVQEAHDLERKVHKRKWVLGYFQEHPCIDCGESDPVVLEFDHISGVKKDNISRMMNDNRSIKLIQEEVKKCVVRCANCHRRKTAMDFGYHRYLESDGEG